MERPARLAWWLLLVGVMIAIAYSTPKPPRDELYHWSVAIGVLIEDGVILGIVLWIARGQPSLLALRRPGSLMRALRFAGIAFVSAFVFEIVYGSLVRNDQHLTPAHWEPSHAAAYVVNGIVICTIIPFVEETTFRGLGFSLLERYGRWPAILGVGLIFGLAHGVVTTLPVFVFLGAVLAWLRSKTNSSFTGMPVHALFNLISLIAAVTING